MRNKLPEFVVVMSCVFLVAQAFPPLHSLPKRSSRRLCGSVLVAALALACDHVYFDPEEYEKRSAYKGDWEEQMLVGLKTKPRGPDFMDSKVASSLFSNQDTFERATRGIIDDCCRKSCSFEELTAYCY